MTVAVAIIAAVAANGVIGNANGIPWHLPSDFAHFKRMTKGKPLVAEWRLRSPRVQIRLSGKPGAESKSSEQIALPASIQDLCRADPEKAEEIQLHMRRDFERLIAEGRAAVGFKLDREEGVYLLEPYED